MFVLREMSKGFIKKHWLEKSKISQGLILPLKGSENPFIELRTHEKDLETCKTN